LKARGPQEQNLTFFLPSTSNRLQMPFISSYSAHKTSNVHLLAISSVLMTSPILEIRISIQNKQMDTFTAWRASMKTHSSLRPLILCVGNRDTESELELRREVLEAAGYRVLIAASAQQALALFRENRVALVLTEHIPPTTAGGPSFTATLKTLKPDVPIAIYSAEWSAWPEDMRFAAAFITKLVSVDELLNTIEKLLAGAPPKVAA
jgi:CheY-like chemotaxis protein